MVAIPKQSGGAARHHCGKRTLTVEEGDLSQVIPVEIQEIKHIVGQVRFRSCLERILQALKTDDSIRLQRNDFAIEPRGLDGQRRSRRGNVPQFGSPIVGISRDKFGRPILHPA